MTTLVVQIIIQQWDKAEQTEADAKARQQSPDRYPLLEANAQSLSAHQIVLDQHGDDRMGNRVQYELTDDGRFIIDRLCFDLNSQSLEYIAQPDSMLPAEPVADLNDGWIQCRYQWRYKVYEGGFHYWLYESITINAGFVEHLQKDMFTHSEPKHLFEG